MQPCRRPCDISAQNFSSILCICILYLHLYFSFPTYYIHVSSIVAIVMICDISTMCYFSREFLKHFMYLYLYFSFPISVATKLETNFNPFTVLLGHLASLQNFFSFCKRVQAKCCFWQKSVYICLKAFHELFVPASDIDIGGNHIGEKYPGALATFDEDHLNR